MSDKWDLSLYLVTDTELCARRGVVRTVRAAVAGGVGAVQVRDPRATGRELYELVVAVREALTGTGVALLVNDRVDIAVASGADGVHLGQSDVPVDQARGLVGPDMLVGLSVSNRGELEQANAFAAGTIDYLGIGPVFSTPTKPNAVSAIGVGRLRELVTRATVPVVAIGGLHLGNASEVAGTGAGIAVVSEICAAEDAQSAAASLRKVVT